MTDVTLACDDHHNHARAGYYINLEVGLVIDVTVSCDECHKLNAVKYCAQPSYS
jgi:hypothetical protein